MMPKDHGKAETAMLTSKISPSLMCADFLALGAQLREMKECGIEYLHIDVMDGVFVPNYTLGTDFIKRLHAATDIPLDIHLMITNPGAKLDWFEVREGDYVSFHVEAETAVQRALTEIRRRGGKSMLALSPATPLCVLDEVLPDLDAVLLMTVNPGFAGQKLVPQTLDKITRLRALLDARGYENVEIEVDGNVNFPNAVRMRQAGANIFVAGTSSLFAAGTDLRANTEKLRECIR